MGKKRINTVTKKQFDLHGIRHSDVRKQVIQFIEDNWDSEEDLTIITGHSTKMKEIVKVICDEYKLLSKGHDFDPSKLTISFN